MHWVPSVLDIAQWIHTTINRFRWKRMDNEHPSERGLLLIETKDMKFFIWCLKTATPTKKNIHGD